MSAMNRVNTEEYFFIITGIIVLTTLVLFILYFIIQYQKKQKSNALERENIRSKYEKQLLETQLEIQEQTLKTISQEIHDNVGQVLSLAKLNLGTFQDTENEYNRVKINDTKQLVSKAINDLRDLSRSLYGDRISELGLHESIANELKILQNTGQFKTALKVMGNSFKLDPQKEMVIFRIVQEAINNAVKHSRANNILVQTVYQQGVFKLIINDNGVGFDMHSLQSGQKGIGLKSMQNRAALIGGTFLLESTGGKGTTVTIELLMNNNLTE